MKQDGRARLLTKQSVDGVDDKKGTRWSGGKTPYQELVAKKTITSVEAAHLMKRTKAALAAKEAIREALTQIGQYQEHSDILNQAIAILDDYVLERALFPPIVDQKPIFR